jgi:hypothetical protein
MTSGAQIDLLRISGLGLGKFGANQGIECSRLFPVGIRVSL